VGLTTYPVKKKIVEKPPRNSAGFCGGGQGLSWAVEPRKARRRNTLVHVLSTVPRNLATGVKVNFHFFYNEVVK
jgi:hypothetical protein